MNNNLPKKYIEQLTEFISFKSISTDASYSEECHKTAQWLKNLFLKNNFEVKIDQGPTTNPLVMAKYHQDKDMETILIYGHYDVQPAEEKEGWSHDPFTLTERDGRLSARGAIDNKGQVFVHIYTILELMRENQLKYNIIFMIEGNEESSNHDISEQLEKNKDFLKSDYVLISDGETTKNLPTVELSFRGGTNMTININTAPNNFHSGIYGGAVPNAALVLSQILAKIKDEKNNVLISGFYTDTDDISPEIKEMNSSIASTEEILELSGVKELLTEDDLDFYTQTGLRPTIEISGITSGYTGVGYLNIVPAHAEARLNIRTAPGQDTEKVTNIVKTFIEKETPNYATLKVQAEEGGNSIALDSTSEKLEEIKEILEEIYQQPVVSKHVGGSIPIVSDFIEKQNMNVISVSLANEDCNMHGIHENFDISMVKNGLAFSRRFFQK
ncbi:MAG: acetylornithine deacetylase/succinyl-diaminopimelate desuccinylase-like protein [Flavobacteriaceae bacterium]|jgi:acetylornithine deacetylase/succinyl-diaminopimelate desuccinylase-like protein